MKGGMRARGREGNVGESQFACNCNSIKFNKIQIKIKTADNVFSVILFAIDRIVFFPD